MISWSFGSKSNSACGSDGSFSASPSKYKFLWRKTKASTISGVRAHHFLSTTILTTENTLFEGIEVGIARNFFAKMERWGKQLLFSFHQQIGSSLRLMGRSWKHSSTYLMCLHLTHPPHIHHLTNNLIHFLPFIWWCNDLTYFSSNEIITNINFLYQNSLHFMSLFITSKWKLWNCGSKTAAITIGESILFFFSLKRSSNCSINFVLIPLRVEPSFLSGLAA